MGSTPVAQPSPPRRVKVSRAALLIALLGVAAGLLVVGALVLVWPDERTERRTFAAGRVEDFAPGSVTTFAGEEFHLVRLPDGEFLALSMLDPHDKLLVEEGLAPSPCHVPWRPDFTFLGQTGWFRNPCHGETYDLAGQCISGPCPRGLDRFPVTVKDGEIEIDLGELILGRPASAQVTPVSPP